MPPLIHPGVAFLDRDGTINRKASEGDYITAPDKLEVLPGVPTAIRRLNEAGVTVIVVTNQRGIALGRMSEADLQAVHAELSTRLGELAGARVDAFFHCPHDLDECDCRKPGTGMFRQAERRFRWIDLGASAIVGDSPSDVQAGLALGMLALRIGFDVPDLSAAVDQLLRADTLA